ncbi:hypothetical protein SAMN06295905_0216 [Devosia lucknowensis]|uniref:Uncharacterized protein n=1 Tax=Devosia lucknowensis TaxID=1096929 RepID=A0A1Y6E9T7_9HYPH|nr:hypothetical protein [Devosia lucknowensis]SMQ59347.1 hypothetical protein SAMN06295905_0216 [Devosia lucknowensis]
MIGAPASAVRPGNGRIAAIVLLGPLVGAICLFIATVLVEPLPGGSFEPVELVIFILASAYMFGLIPSVLAATVYWVVEPIWRVWSWPRLVLAYLVIGAVCGALGVFLSISALERQPIVNEQIILIGALCGALSLVATALPFRKVDT